MSESESGSLLIRHGVGLSHPFRVVNVILDGKQVGTISSFNAPSGLENGTFPLSPGEHVIEVVVGPVPLTSKKIVFTAEAGKQAVFRVICLEFLMILGAIPGGLLGLLIRSALPESSPYAPLYPLIIAFSAIFSLVIWLLACLITPGIIVRLKNESR